MKRFWDKVDKTETCWLWTACRLTRGGYGRFRLDGETHLAHRLAYVWTFGPIPEGKEVHHTCDTPACVNPDHLIPVTSSEHRYIDGNDRHSHKMHCRNGHSLEDAHQRSGWRRCRTCEREANRRAYVKRRVCAS